METVDRHQPSGYCRMTTTLALGQEPIEQAKQKTDDLVLWSVTTIIGVLDKPALMYWASEMTARAAIASARSLSARLQEEGEETVVKWLRDARFRKPADRLSATDLGTCFHGAAESYALTATRPDADWLENRVRQAGGPKFTAVTEEAAVLSKMLDQFDGWLSRFTPSYQATEVCVMSPTYGVAGTADGFLTIDGTRFIFDIKTSRETLDSQGNQRSPYPEVALQLAGYRFAELAAVWRPRRTEKWRRRYYLISADERAMGVPVPEVDTGLCLHVTPGSCEGYPIRCDEEVYRSFLFVLEAARWQLEMSKSVIGFPLEGPTKWEAS